MENPFQPHRPKVQQEPSPSVGEYNTAHGELYNIIDNLRTRPGESINLTIPEESVDLSTTLTQTVVVGEVTQEGGPTESITNLVQIKAITINMNALGGPRKDSFYRSVQLDSIYRDYDQKLVFNNNIKQLKDNIRQLEDFLTRQDAAIICLQDMPIYLMRFIGPKLNSLGYSYYANVFGSNGGGEGALMANVTLINTNAFNGYTLESASLSITPHTQGTRRVVTTDALTYEYGSHQAELEDWEANYGVNSEDGDTTHNAFQTFNTKFRIRGTDGSRTLVVGNIYVSPPSLQVERAKSIKSSLANLTALKDREDDIVLFMGDTNTYGVDTTAAPATRMGLSAHPVFTGISALSHADQRENKHSNKIAQQLGYVIPDNHAPTITKLGGIVGMQLDRVMAHAGSGTSIEAAPVKVSFTDHHALVSTVTFKPSEPVS